MGGLPRGLTAIVTLTATVLLVMAVPASAGTTKVSGVGVFNDDCRPPQGSPPANLGDYPPNDLTGNLVGCWYTYVETAVSRPSGAYQETGTELFVGCLNGPTCGTFSTTYTFTGKFDPTGSEIHGRCHHAIVGGTGGFAGASGEIQFHDDVAAGTFPYRGNIRSEAFSARAATRSAATASYVSGGC